MNELPIKEYIKKNYVHKDVIRKIIRQNEEEMGKIKKAFPNFYKINEKYMILNLINNVLNTILEDKSLKNNIGKFT